MRSIILPWKRTVGFAAGIAGIAAFARGQDLIQTSAHVVAYSGEAVPGVPGVTFSTASIFDSASIDDSGAVIFRARIAGTGVTALNERAIFRGSTYGNLAVLIRSQDPAPGLPGLTLNAAATTGVGGSPREASNGLTLWGSSLSGPGVTTSNDTALFGGFAGSLGLVAREGDPAPGTVGATFGTNINNLSYQATGVIKNGRVLFQSATLGGDTTSANNAAWFSGSPGALELVQRKGSGNVALGGAVIGGLGFVSQMNDAGQVFIDAPLSTTLGTPPATAANDQTLWIWTPGSGITLVAREGDPAPGTVGATLNSANNANFFFNGGADVFNNAGQGIVQCDLRGGDVIPGINDRGLYMATTSGLTMLIRRGTPAPGTDGGFDTINNPSTHLNNSGQIAFEGIISGGTQNPGNDTGIWTGTPGNLRLVVREGDPAPGTNGATFYDFNGRPMLMNEQGRILFSCQLIGGDTTFQFNDQAYYCWDPILGLMLVARLQDQFQVAPGDTRTIASFGHVQFGDGDGNPLSFNRNGQFALRVSFTVPINGSNGAILTFNFPTCNGPSIVAQPSSAVACPGGSASFSVVASGSPAPTYQWQFNGSPLTDGGEISGSTSATLTIHPVSAADYGSYTCVLTGSCGSVTTNAATLAIIPTDTDGDGTPDCIDGCPNDPNKIAPGICGCGVSDVDTDGDGTPDCIDGCPNDPSKIAPGICGCGVSDVDTDGDGTPDCHDGCPTDPTKVAPGVCGCGVSDVDTDGDGTPDCHDGCPNDPSKIAPGVCGCGVSDVDTDGDGTPDCHDGCPNDRTKIAPGQCGCGVPDTDTDGDGTADCHDGCPNDRTKIAPGQCGCGIADTDTDGDGIADCHDNCPLVSNPGQLDVDGDGIGDACDNCVHIANHDQADCNANGMGDVCEIAAGAPDCNFNGIPDSCDLADHTSLDVNANGIPDECELDGGTPFCFGDGHPGTCPCGNTSTPGLDQGCLNSTGQGGKLSGTGATKVSADGLVLHASNMIQGVCVFLQGDAVTQAPFGDGLRCASGQLIRLATKSIAAGSSSYPQAGDPTISVKGAVPPAGGVRYYQVFYRNPNGSPCGTFFNITSGVNVIWQP